MSDVPNVDVILEQMGTRVADMDHLVEPVLEDLDAAYNRVRTPTSNWLDDFLCAAQALRNQYHEEGLTGRYFVVDTIMNLVEMESDDDQS